MLGELFHGGWNFFRNFLIFQGGTFSWNFMGEENFHEGSAGFTRIT